MPNINLFLRNVLRENENAKVMTTAMTDCKIDSFDIEVFRLVNQDDDSISLASGSTLTSEQSGHSGQMFVFSTGGHVCDNDDDSGQDGHLG